MAVVVVERDAFTAVADIAVAFVAVLLSQLLVLLPLLLRSY